MRPGDANPEMSPKTGWHKLECDFQIVIMTKGQIVIMTKGE